ncbi:MAG: S8 family serine peptidase [Lachnospiraceae bacterium]|nr:S8 family serine peptidase [Lachnospiraceae bacterium]
MARRYFSRHSLMAVFCILPCFLFSDTSALRTGALDTASKDLVVLFDADATVAAQTQLLSATGAKTLWHENNAALLRTSAAESALLLDTLSTEPIVCAADYDASVALSAISEDAYSSSQWGLDNSGRYSYIADMNTSTILSAEDIDMNAPEAWTAYEELADDSREVIVAIIDTGVDINHPDLAYNIWVNEGEIPDDGIDNDNNGYVDDIYGWDFFNEDNTVCHYAEDGIHTNLDDNDNHGTHIAGIIAAVKDNSLGIAGVASNIDVKIMVLKIHGDKNGSGTISNAVRAIRYATAMGADICNISWGTSKSNATLKQVIRESDMLFVAAAGNSGTNTDESPIYPASYDLDNLIAVTFIDANGLLSAKSNYGATSVDIAAPGIHIYSTCVGDYCSFSGSSMATPHVTGVAALLYSCGGNLYPSNVRELILNTVKPLSTLEGKTVSAGIPDMLAALQATTDLKHDYSKPSLSFQSGFQDEAIVVTVKAKDKGGSGIRTIRYASGVKELSYFQHGTVGNAITNGSVSFSKAGKYTFYVSDYAGNERAVIYQVVDDTTAPTATLSYQVAYNYKSSTITLKAADTESGIKTIKYASGEQPVDYFLAADAGTSLALTSGSVKFNVANPGVYTIYLCDYRGNKSVHTINVEIIKSTALKLKNYTKTVLAGKTYQIVPTLTPAASTDKLKYRSSNTAVCKVSASGKVTAIAPGTAKITVTTASGIKRTCTITVKEAAK